VLAIRRGKEFIISPGARQIIEESDVLIVLGSNEKLKLFETES
jgi:TrkA-C domain.